MRIIKIINFVICLIGLLIGVLKENLFSLLFFGFMLLYHTINSLRERE